LLVVLNDELERWDGSIVTKRPVLDKSQCFGEELETTREYGTYEDARGCPQRGPTLFNRVGIRDSRCLGVGVCD
jgi:hypothetical protein